MLGILKQKQSKDLVETVTVFRHPSHPDGVIVEFVGRLTALLGEQADPTTSEACGERW
jgi:hypothetical protein